LLKRFATLSVGLFCRSKPWPNNVAFFQHASAIASLLSAL